MTDIVRFADRGLLWMLAVLAPVAAYYVYRALQGGAAIGISTTAPLASARRSVKYYLRHLPFVLRCAALTLLIIALARPQSSESGSNSSTEGIDIVLSLDISGSMLARDFQPDRFSAAKKVAANFIVDRANDRVGLVVFAGESVTQCPLTTDKRTLLNLLEGVKMGVVADGTAIGDGLATAVNRLKESDAKSKVIILLTDGVNNLGQISPLTAADIAKSFNIKVYTIGVGTMGMAPTPAIDMWGGVTYVPAKVEIDEDILRQIAAKTGGQYFRATDNDKLKEIYDNINSLERNKIEVDDFTRYHELYIPFALVALALLVLEFLLQTLWLRRIP
ncbi:MAG: VWA domain-containing protein [Rikenellaceae bacterium]|jgi:Ca-activated chloride channel family protein|nr:VWA domain-containing protein [Rikenellaceae bacterium]